MISGVSETTAEPEEFQTDNTSGAALRRLALPPTPALVTFGPIGCTQHEVCFQNLDLRGSSYLLEYRDSHWTVISRSFPRAFYLEQMACTSSSCVEGLTRSVKGDPVGSELVRFQASGTQVDRLSGTDSLYGTAIDPAGRLYITTLNISNDTPSYILSAP